MENRNSIWLKTDTKILLEKLSKLQHIKSREQQVALLFSRHIPGKQLSRLIAKHNRFQKALETVQSFFSNPQTTI